jgi:hypothetical protein
MMLDLVFWSGSLAIVVWALEVVWWLIAGIAGPIGPTSRSELESSHTDDFDIEQAADWHRLPCWREFYGPEWADIDCDRPGESWRRVRPRAR